jgi:hypothetical protein
MKAYANNPLWNEPFMKKGAFEYTYIGFLNDTALITRRAKAVGSSGDDLEDLSFRITQLYDRAMATNAKKPGGIFELRMTAQVIRASDEGLGNTFLIRQYDPTNINLSTQSFVPHVDVSINNPVGNLEGIVSPVGGFERRVVPFGQAQIELDFAFKSNGETVLVVGEMKSQAAKKAVSSIAGKTPIANTDLLYANNKVEAAVKYAKERFEVEDGAKVGYVIMFPLSRKSEWEQLFLTSTHQTNRILRWSEYAPVRLIGVKCDGIL